LAVYRWRILDLESFWTRLIALRWMGRYADLGHVGYVTSAALVAMGWVTAALISHFVQLPDLGIVFLPAVLLSAILWGRGPSLWAALLSVAISSILYHPAEGLVEQTAEFIDTILFVGVAIAGSDLAAHIRRQADEATHRETMMAQLYAFSRRLAGIADPDELFRAIVEHLRAVLGADVVLLLPIGGELVVAAGSGTGFSPQDGAAAEALWAQQAIYPAEPPLPSGWQFRKLRSGRTNVALLATHDTAGFAVPKVSQAYLDSLLDQAAVAIERTQLARAYEDARVRAKTESLREALLNSISHDLQTPLASIVGSSTALQSFEGLYDSEARGELIATIREEAERLHHIIGNILDLTRIKAGDISPRLEFVELADIMNAALRRTRRSLADHQLTVLIPADLPMLRLDLFLMEHALVNLLENAAKYAPKGTRIGVAARLEDSNVLIEVTDSGVGISSVDLERIFDRFVRAATTDARPAGSGLGLTICRAFVEANGGQVEAYSPGPGKGATFRVRLPVPEASVSLDTAVHDE
jgi:two-component system sensor histidine kinase KdpD